MITLNCKYNIAGRRLDELNPGEYRGTKNTLKPVVVEGNWEEPTPEEQQKHDTVHKLQVYSKTCVKQPLSKRQKIGFQDQLSLTAGQKYCRMLPLEHSAILLTFIKLPFVIKTFVLSIFEWPF